ncbi:hypothetical protein IQ238_23600 [Pleurocapsales cyanobacterium LEGE 06147]|nr:hypothetical protein [Pleurocapsales cyanobacterium LEGE 06147]
MKLILRQATEKDLAWMESLHTENMKGYVERVYPWNPILFRKNFQAREYKVIEFKAIFIDDGLQWCEIIRFPVSTFA